MMIKVHLGQGRNGAIVMSRGRGHFIMTQEDISRLGVDLFGIEDFSLDSYKEYYGL